MSKMSHANSKKETCRNWIFLKNLQIVPLIDQIMDNHSNFSEKNVKESLIVEKRFKSRVIWYNGFDVSIPSKDMIFQIKLNEINRTFEQG